MGIDCKLAINDEYIDLDRWYVFSPEFTSKEAMDKSQALDKLHVLSDTIDSYADTSEERDYFLFWQSKATEAIMKVDNHSKIVFFAEHDIPDEYYLR